MQSSIFLAQLMGPVILAAAISLFINGERQVAMAREFLESPSLIYLSGILLMTAGLAVVLAHNVWVLDWRLIITLLGWLAVIGGTLRITFFRTVEKLGEAVLDSTWGITAAGLVWFVLGAALCFFAYIA
ncbi:MAG: hypothetical protein AAF967_07545 [Pseudomonadota bacterium]